MSRSCAVSVDGVWCLHPGVVEVTTLFTEPHVDHDMGDNFSVWSERRLTASLCEFHAQTFLVEPPRSFSIGAASSKPPGGGS